MNSGADTLAGGFPHSEIRGSTIARISPQLIAACHVLHRLLAPRHPPNALIALIMNHTNPHAGPSPTHIAVQHKLCPATTFTLTTHLDPPKPLAQPQPTTTHRDQPFRFTCQTTPPPASSSSGALRRTAKPVVQRHVRATPGNGLKPLDPGGKPYPHPLTSYGDGRYRTDGPLLAKQVLYH